MEGKAKISEIWEMPIDIESIKKLQKNPTDFKKYGKRIK